MMMRTTYVLRTLMLGIVVVAGCKDSAESTTSNGGTGDGASETGAGMTGSTGVVGSTGGEPTSSAGTAMPSTGGESMFLVPTDMGSSFECDIWVDDCPEGQKCMPWDNTMGLDTWNATRCSPIDANPGQEGDPCTMQESNASGLDTCDEHLICWFTDDMLVGTCSPMCTGSEAAPSCPSGKKCDVSNEGSIILCLQLCEPLVQSCPDDQICFFDGVQDFICDFDASGMEGQYGDACAYINVCDFGLFCAFDPLTVPGCASNDGCCSEYCDTSAPSNTCSGAPMQQCLPWYDDAPPPPGQENVGKCAVPT